MAAPTLFGAVLRALSLSLLTASLLSGCYLSHGREASGGDGGRDASPPRPCEGLYRLTEIEPDPSQHRIGAVAMSETTVAWLARNEEGLLYRRGRDGRRMESLLIDPAYTQRSAILRSDEAFLLVYEHTTPTGAPDGLWVTLVEDGEGGHSEPQLIDRRGGDPRLAMGPAPGEALLSFRIPGEGIYVLALDRFRGTPRGAPTLVSEATYSISALAAEDGGSYWLGNGEELYRIAPGGAPERVASVSSFFVDLAITEGRVLAYLLDGTTLLLDREGRAIGEGPPLGPRAAIAAYRGSFLIAEPVASTGAVLDLEGRTIFGPFSLEGGNLRVGAGPGGLVILHEPPATGSPPTISLLEPCED